MKISSEKISISPEFLFVCFSGKNKIHLPGFGKIVEPFNFADNLLTKPKHNTMKKFFGMLAIAGLLVACNNESESTEVTDSTTITTDTTVVAPIDTTTVDTTAVADTTQL